MELAIALGVVGLLLAAIWVAASRANEKARVSDAVAELQTVVGYVLSVWQGRTFPLPIFTSQTPFFIGAGMIPSWAVVNATEAGNPWNPVGLGIGIISTNGITANEFRIAFIGVPVDGCIALLTQATSCQTGQGGCPVAVYSSAVGGPGPADTATPVAVTGWQAFGAVAATALCNSADNLANPGVQLDYSL
jgi:hypothetical protein